MKSTVHHLKWLWPLFVASVASAQTAVTLTSSKLPIVIINTKGKTIIDDPKIVVNMRIIYNGKGKMNYVTDKVYHYNNYIGIEKRGNSSQSFEQLQYGVETKDSATGKNLDFPLLGMPADNDWVLYAPYNDISMMRNILAYQMWNEMGHWAPRTRLCELILNGIYQGVYVLMESIKRSDHRVGTAKLKDTDTSKIDITGGYIMKIDARNSPDDMTFESKVPGVVKVTGTGGGFGNPTPTTMVTWIYHYPKADEIRPKQAQYIRNYIDTVEAVIQSGIFADPVEGYAKYISNNSFIDYFIHTELSRNGDGYKRSAFFYKEKKKEDGTGGKLKAGPVWDYNLAYGNVNFCQGNLKTGWTYEGCETLPVPALWPRLLQDPAFKNAVKCRYQELRKTILNDSYINSVITKYAQDSLKEAQARQLAKYPKLIQPSSGGGIFNDPLWYAGYRVTSYAAEIDTLKNWFTKRLAWLDKNITGTGTCVVVTSLSDQVNTEMEATFSIYPNPSIGAFTIDSKNTIASAEIVDAQGRFILTKLVNAHNVTIEDLKELPEGMYFVKIYYDTDKVKTMKLLKSK